MCVCVCVCVCTISFFKVHFSGYVDCIGFTSIQISLKLQSITHAKSSL